MKKLIAIALGVLALLVSAALVITLASQPPPAEKSLSPAKRRSPAKSVGESIMAKIERMENGATIEELKNEIEIERKRRRRISQ